MNYVAEIVLYKTPDTLSKWMDGFLLSFDTDCCYDIR